MSEHNNKLELLGSAPIPKALMSLGVPIMIGMLINALYNLVDAYFVSGLGKSQMGAIPIPFANCCAVEDTLRYRLGILPMHALP